MASLYSRVGLIICIAMISIAHADDEIASNNSTVIHPQETLNNSTILTMQQISKVASDFAENGVIEKLINNSSNNNNALALSALRSCRELLSLAMDNLNKSLSTPVDTVEGRGSVKSRLCATGVTLHTCVDEFNGGLRDLVFQKLKEAIYRNAEVNKVMAVIHSETDHLLGQDSADGYPRWLSDSDRELLLRGAKSSADAVVAKDGSGKYSRIWDAIQAAPRWSKKRFVIYVKSGMYHENVKVGADKWNVMMIGDGMDKTIVYSNLSNGGGQSTWESATFGNLFLILFACLF
ncbi:pectinesterase/pectinesterase inhibitor PPE8B-like [Salvia miltiorrhiza]|uniref:pectinesterase/pectinesterase inhibitor PPE8B-like n=1 Tax=Salvia miltiorrhiza TaxID=226208 RepID=UPI0025AD4C9F|nr:pectinesterase/pectinesterase inhibitor PPE8B-like [Salvia miltiorrhiza]